jgi:hypothetical protein
MAKKRKSKASPKRQGISGNPARRAQQLIARPPEMDQSAELFRALTETVGDEWWPDSHNAIIERLSDLPVGSLLRLESAVVELVGAEYWARLQSETRGFHQDPYLAALADLVRDELQIALQTGEEWQDLWRMLHGIAAMTPPATGQMLRRDPDIAVREAIDDAETALTKAGIVPEWPTRIRQAEPVGEPLIVADTYGSRFALLAPFAWGQDDRHWYCWDIDRCGRDMVVSAGVFASSEEALTEWRSAVGPIAAPATAAPVPCDDATAREMLNLLTRSDLLVTLLIDHESRQDIDEYFRMRQRARALCGRLSSGARASQTRVDLDPFIDDFAAWLETRGGDRPEREDIATLADSWSNVSGPGYYACSPHRIEHTVVIVADGYLDEYAEAALDLLPQWVEWCIERSGLAGEPAERARAAARNNRWDGTDDQRLRRPE